MGHHANGMPTVAFPRQDEMLAVFGLFRLNEFGRKTQFDKRVRRHRAQLIDTVHVQRKGVDIYP